MRESPTKLWIGTNTHGLFLLDQSSGSLTGYHRKSGGGRSDSGDRIQEIAQDRNGTLWIATGDGVDMFDPLSGTYREYIPSHQAPGKSMYTRMSVDSTGTLWIGTADDGLYYVPTSSYRFPRYALRGPSGLPMEMETINRWSDGSYWIGAEGKLVQIRMEDLKVLRIVDLFSGKRGGYERAAWASHDDGKGRLWIGTWGLGLFGFEPRTGQVTNYRYSKTLTTLAFKDDICRSIVGTSGDTLWIAAYNDRLVSFDTRHRVFSSIPHDIRGQIDHLMKTRSGQIWISDEFLGLFVADPPAYRPRVLVGQSHGLSRPQQRPSSIELRGPTGENLGRRQGAVPLGTGNPIVQDHRQ